jgi:hypothetical protein
VQVDFKSGEGTDADKRAGEAANKTPEQVRR